MFNRRKSRCLCCLSYDDTTHFLISTLITCSDIGRTFPHVYAVLFRDVLDNCHSTYAFQGKQLPYHIYIYDWTSQVLYSVILKMQCISGNTQCRHCPKLPKLRPSPFVILGHFIGKQHTPFINMDWLYHSDRSNHIDDKVQGEITYPFPSFNDCTIEVWEWISNAIPHFIADVITYPCRY